VGFLIDTCIWVDVERGTISPADVAVFTKEEPVYISPVTIAELTFGMEMANSRDLRNKRAAALNRLKKKPLLSIDELTGDIFGRIAASLRVQLKTHRHRVQDIWLASQAIQYDFGLVTMNVRDFEDIPGLKLIVMPKK
jgi:predicted nucleic acid-binding protein